MELIEPERLGQVVVGPGVEGRNLVALLVPGREDEDRSAGIAPHVADDREAVGVGQSEVEQHQVGSALVPGRQRLGPGRGLSNSVAMGGEVRGEGTARRLIVLDEQQLRSRSISHASASPSSVGRRMVTASPPIGLEAAETLPPIASTSPRTTARPRPMPGRAADAVAGPR